MFKTRWLWKMNWFNGSKCCDTLKWLIYTVARMRVSASFEIIQAAILLLEYMYHCSGYGMLLVGKSVIEWELNSIYLSNLILTGDKNVSLKIKCSMLVVTCYYIPLPTSFCSFSWDSYSMFHFICMWSENGCNGWHDIYKKASYYDLGMKLFLMLTVS